MITMKLKQKIGRIIIEILNIRFLFKYGLKIGRHVKISKGTLLDIRNGGKIIIGNDVTLNSQNKGYHINMHSPVKLFVDISGAEITIGNNTRIHGSCIHAYKSIKVGAHCLIAANCQIMDCSGHDLSFECIENRINTKGTSRPVIIEDCVWIGANSIILPGVTIGKGSVIGAGSVVTKNIPPMSIAAGNPAKVIRTFS